MHILRSIPKEYYIPISLGLLFLFLISFPLIASRYLIFLLSLALIYAIWALGYNFLFGYTGLLSFGHAAYLGVGAYTVGLLIARVGIKSFEILFLAAVLTSLGISALIGYLCVKYTEVYFALLTLAFGEFFYALAFKLYDITGGSDGVSVPYPYLFGYLMDTKLLYYVVAVLFVILLYFAWKVVNSPFGKTLQAIREDPVKAEFVGIHVKRYQWYSFILSGVYSGIAGALYAPLFAHIYPDLFHWTTSGEVLFVTLIGGHRMFLGPVLGAIIYAFLRSYITAYTIYWPFVLGLSVAVIALIFPNGIIGSAYSFIKERYFSKTVVSK
ncbi:branched-chain amino acid ABC transporter permease [Candidatus Geothermarchaeota archaeon]|nr:MAG: branched-chain amino acid ABC transporter permease [Candidatus Geothermarchaeota archaeon]HEW93422.1 branched-chain amino acid ABC transporter permease [Thermoprotei archaeon]